MTGGMPAFPNLHGLAVDSLKGAEVGQTSTLLCAGHSMKTKTPIYQGCPRGFFDCHCQLERESGPTPSSQGGWRELW